MNTGLSQLTLDTLHAFAARRRMLIAVRGACVGIVSLVVVMSLVAIADAIFIIKSQPLRWSISLAGYALVALVIWITCLRSLLRIPGSREVARLIEQRAPGLREDLLSAVELGSSQSDSRFDSPVFRSLLQSSVEQRLGAVQVQSLLPAGLIRGAAFLATAVLMICVALLLVPDLRFASRLTRAMLPSAAVDRVSNVRVNIIAPNPADALVPHNDAVKVVVELQGAEAESVVIETFRAEDDREGETIELKAEGGPRQFAGTIQLRREPVKYRVLAGDAVTRLFTIDTAARPRAVAFAKTYRAPGYADIESRSVQEKHGNLEGIEGTQVDLILDVDEPISSGELRFDETNGAQPAITLTRIDDRQWQASVPIGKPTTYKVHLIAAKTGFDNAFDPPYEIKSVPDAAPTLTIESPAKDMLVPPAHAVKVKLNAEDDLGLARVSQWFRINGGEWREILLTEKAGRIWGHERLWDVYELNLRAGDQVAVKFAAIDGAGSKTESAPVSITIAATGFDPQRLAALEAKRNLLESIAALRTTSETLTKSMAIDVAKMKGASDLQRRQLLTNGHDAALRLQEEANGAWQLASRAIKANSTDIAAYELVQIGRNLSEIRDANMPRARDVFARGLADDSKSSLLDARLPQSYFDDALLLVKQAHARLTLVVASDEVDALLRDLLVLRREQGAITSQDLPDEPATWQRLARRQLLLTAQVKQAEALAASFAIRDEKQSQVIAKITAHLSVPREAAEKSLAVLQIRASIDRAISQVATGIDAAIIDLLPLARSLSAAATTLHRDSSSPHRMLFHAADMLSQPPREDAANPLADLTAWKAVADILKSAGALEEARADSHALIVADTALYRRALLAIHARMESEAEPQVRARLARVAVAFRTLESGHDLIQAQALAVSLASREKWMRSQPLAVTVHPREWAALMAWQPRLIKQLEEAGMSPRAGATLGVLPRSSAALILDVEMNSRRVKGQIAQRRTAQFEQIAAHLAEASLQIRDEVIAARAVIAAEVPSLNEQMAALAREARLIEGKAEAAAKKIEEGQGSPENAEAKKLASDQAALDAKLNELLDDLRQEANAQDSFSKEGRERARDADNAAAMVRAPAEKALAAANEAAAADEAAKQQSHLKEAAHEDHQLAKTLEELAEHYKNLEAGKGEETRSVLRDAERELGIKREMDAQFARMERLADLAQKSPEAQAAELERELKQNPAMQQELSDIAKEAVAAAKESLEDAAAQERRVAQDLAESQRQAQQAKPNVAGQMNELARKANELAKKIPAIEQNATKGTAKDAAAAAKQAGQSLQQAGGVSPPADPKDHKAAAAQAGELADALKNASEQLKSAAHKAAAAAERIRDEEGAATASLSVGNASSEDRLKAADTLLHAKPRQDAAKRAAADAREAAKQAAEMADAAAKISSDVSSAANAGAEAIEEGLKKQPAIAEALAEAGEEIARAARHEERMEKNAAANALDQLKDSTQQKAAKAVADAANQLAQAKQPGEAQAAVQSAEKSIAGEVEELGQMLKGEQSQKRGASGGQEPGDEQAKRDEEAAKWMARALDELDRSMNEKSGQAPELALSPQAKQRLAEAQAKGGEKPGQGSEGKQPGEQGSGASQASGQKPAAQGQPSAAKSGEQASQAVREAAAAQARAMAQARQGGPDSGEPAGEPMAAKPQNGKPSGSAQGGPGESPGGEGESTKMASGQGKPSDAKGKGAGGTGNRGNAAEAGELPSLPAMRPGEWGKLPARLAKELMEGQRDDIPSEYRSQVEAYFRAIAQKAKSK